MNDVTKAIAKDFRDLASVNPILAALMKKLENEKADYLDADKYALELAKVLGKALQINLGEDKIIGDEYRELIEEALPKGLYTIYEDVADYAQTIQKGLNERMKVDLKTVKPKFNTKEADAITWKAKAVDSYDEIPGGLVPDMEHMAQNVATDTMKANAKLAHDVGKEAIVSRKYDGVGLHGGKKDCKWCLSRCGMNIPYSKAIAMDMFRRHPGCGCKISYAVNGRTQVQTDWRSNQWEEKQISQGERQYEIWRKYGNEENLMLFGSPEELTEWQNIKNAIGFNEIRLKNRLAANSDEWKSYIEHCVLGAGGTRRAEQVESMLLRQWGFDSARMTPDEISALRFWTSNSYAEISEAMRLNNGRSEINEYIRLINNALDKTTTTDTLYLRRGIGDKRLKEILKKIDGWEEDSSKAIGADYLEPSFIATTPFKNGAYGGKHHIYFKVPPGTKGAYIKEISHADDELEFLMQAGTKGRIVNIKKSSPDRWGNCVYDIFVEIL